MYEEQRFDQAWYDDAKTKRMCICSHFNNKHEAKPPFNRSCPYHGEKKTQ